MERSQTYQQLGEGSLEEHRQIHFYLDQIVAALGELSGATTVEPMRRLAARIESLRERLVEHHEREERGRLYPAILDALPEARDELVRLRRQHEKMVEILELAKLHAANGAPAEAQDLRIDLERFLTMIRHHEQDEEALLERAIRSQPD